MENKAQEILELTRGTIKDAHACAVEAEPGLRYNTFVKRVIAGKDPETMRLVREAEVGRQAIKRKAIAEKAKIKKITQGAA